MAKIFNDGRFTGESLLRESLHESTELLQLQKLDAVIVTVNNNGDIQIDNISPTMKYVKYSEAGNEFNSFISMCRGLIYLLGRKQ